MDVASHYSNASGDQDKVRFWLMIAAENGSALAMHLLSGELFEEGGRINCERAVYWLKHLSQLEEYVDGHPVPGFIEKEIGEIQAAEEKCQDR